MSNMTEDLLWRHLRGVPAFRALLRAVESRFYQDMDFVRPMLDLGCGDGHFAQTTFVEAPEIGVDPSWQPLSEAQDRQVYKLAIQANGGRLPFADGQFGTVVSNSVLEHIPDVDAVLREAARVMVRPSPENQEVGGLLILTVPSENFARFLSISALLRQMGLDKVAVAYEGWFNRISRHHHCDSPAVWHQRLALVGLETKRWQYYFSRQAHHRLEWGHYLGLPSLISRLVFGRWIIAPWRSSLQWTERWLRPFYEEQPEGEGAYLLFVAQKTALDTEPTALPAPSPISHSVSKPLARPPTPSTSVADQPTDTMLWDDTDSTRSQETAEPINTQTSWPIKSIIWLAAAMLLAVIGQISWNWQVRPNEPGTGLTWYGLALLALTIFAWQSGHRRVQQPVQTGLTARQSIEWMRANYLQVLVGSTGLILSLLAQLSLGDAPNPRGGPVTALILWILGISLVLTALWPGLLDRILGHSERSAHSLGRKLSTGFSSWDRWEILGLLALSLIALLVRLVKLDEIPYVLTGDEASMGREALKVISGDLANPFALGWFSHPTLYYFLLALPLKLFGQNIFALRILSPFAGALSVTLTYVFARRAWGRPVALASAFLLTGYHFHIHFSRLALNNIWDPLFAILVLGLLWSGWKTRNRRKYLLSGVCLGLGQYFYTGARLLLVLVAGLLVYWLLTKRRKLWEERGNLAAALLVAIVVCIPLFLFSVRHPDDYFARMNQLGIIQSGWLEREAIATGRSATSLFSEQVWRSALAFNYTVDPTFWYRPGIPLLRFWPSIFFIFGLGIAIAASKKTSYFILLLWLGGTMIFAGALLENPPSSQRYVIAAPAVCMLVALALVQLAKRLRHLLGGRREVWLGVALILALLFSFSDLGFYFSDYSPRSDLGGVNTEVAQRVSEYLVDLGPDWRVYFFGSPRMGISREHGFPSVAFLAPDADSYDVTEPMSDFAHLPDLQFPATFIFLPERAFELNMVREAFPGCTEKHFPGRSERILFVALEVSH